MVYGLVTCIILNAFISFWYTSWLQTYTQQKFPCIQLSQVQAYILIRSGDPWSTYQEAFVIPVTALTFMEHEADVYAREKS